MHVPPALLGCVCPPDPDRVRRFQIYYWSTPIDMPLVTFLLKKK